MNASWLNRLGAYLGLVERQGVTEAPPSAPGPSSATPPWPGRRIQVTLYSEWGDGYTVTADGVNPIVFPPNVLDVTIHSMRASERGTWRTLSHRYDPPLRWPRGTRFELTLTPGDEPLDPYHVAESLTKDCPVCFSVAGEHCVSLDSGEVGMNWAHPQRDPEAMRSAL